MKSMIMLSASLALAACGASTAPSAHPRAPSQPVAVECAEPHCRIGSNGPRLSGLAVELPIAIRAITLPSAELIPLP